MNVSPPSPPPPPPLHHYSMPQLNAYPYGPYGNLCELYSSISKRGGLQQLKVDYNKYRNLQRMAVPKQDAHCHLKRANALSEQLRRYTKAVADYSPAMKTICSGAFAACKKIQYNHDIHNNSQKMQIGNKLVDFPFHPTTVRTTKANPRPLLFEELVSEVNPPVVDPSCGNVVRISFPKEEGENDDSELYVFYAHKNSKCGALLSLYNSALGNNHQKLDNLLDEIPNCAHYDDHTAGMWYYAAGFGMLGNPTGQPATLMTHQYTATKDIIQIVSNILQSTASTILKYCPHIYHANQLLKDSTNTKLSCPPLTMQDEHCHWFSTQFIIRQIGLGINNKPRWMNKRDPIDKLQDENIISLHRDCGDYCTYQPLIYIPYGGDEGVGGDINKSDLVVCQNKVGGYSVRIKTNIPDTVVVVLMNSHKQLHGLVHDPVSPSDTSAWSTRIIPFITQSAYNWMEKNQSAMPLDRFSNYF